jgi:tRNA pseudouridine32 synthase/23S rRNA pseudouridine746 synthase
MVKSIAMHILFEDSHLLVVDKPAGLPVLPDGWQPDSDDVLKQLRVDHESLLVVHRLDKMTTGVLVVARTPEAHRSLSMQFEQHQAHKIYHAIVNGVPGWEDRTTNLPLRGDVGHKHRTAIDPRRGKPSATTFLVRERFTQHTLLQAQPLTGRTHQIRAHAAALGLPLLGDSLYGAPPTQIIARPALHALSISFMHPETGEALTIKAPYPADFAEALQSLRAGNEPLKRKGAR